MEHKRVFLAIPVNPNKDYIEICDRLKRRLRFDMISWIEPSSAHLTLKFFGNTPFSRIDEISAEVQKCVSGMLSFDFEIDKIGAFGSSHSPKLIWFGVDKRKEVDELHRKIISQIKRIGYHADPGNFVPHITIGRVKKCEDKKWFWESLNEHQNELIQTVKVDRVVLFESILHSKGATHVALHEFLF